MHDEDTSADLNEAGKYVHFCILESVTLPMMRRTKPELDKESVTLPMMRRTKPENWTRKV